MICNFVFRFCRKRLSHDAALCDFNYFNKQKDSFVEIADLIDIAILDRVEVLILYLVGL